MPDRYRSEAYRIAHSPLALFVLLHQFVDGSIERFGGLDDVIVLPEIGIEEVFYLIVEGIAGIE